MVRPLFFHLRSESHSDLILASFRISHFGSYGRLAVRSPRASIRGALLRAGRTLPRNFRNRRRWNGRPPRSFQNRRRAVTNSRSRCLAFRIRRCPPRNVRAVLLILSAFRSPSDPSHLQMPQWCLRPSSNCCSDGRISRSRSDQTRNEAVHSVGWNLRFQWHSCDIQRHRCLKIPGLLFFVL